MIIKFRGRNINKPQEWVYGGYHTCDGDSTVIIHQWGNNLSQHTEVIPESVGQYIELSDKNNKDIYTGMQARYGQRLGIIVYSPFHAAFCHYSKEEKIYVILEKRVLRGLEIINEE